MKNNSQMGKKKLNPIHCESKNMMGELAVLEPATISRDLFGSSRQLEMSWLNY